MSKNNNGGPAFARPYSKAGGFSDSANEHAQTGMTLRDYFAAKAMQSILALGEAYDYEGGTPVEQLPRHAYALADAMLAERAK